MIRTLGISAGLTLLVGLSACSGKKKTMNVIKEADIVKAVTAFDSGRDFAAESTDQAMNILGLAEEGLFSWESKTGENGNYEFKNLRMTEMDSSIDRLVLKGVHMQDDKGPFFDSLYVEGVKVFSDEGVSTATLAKAQINFTQAGHDNIEKRLAFMGMDDFLDDIIRMDFEPLLGGSAYFDDLVFSPQGEGSVNADFLGWMPGEDPAHTSMLMDEVVYKISDLEFSANKLSLKNFDIMGLDDDSSDFEISSLNPFDPGQDSFIAEDLTFNVDGLVLSAPTIKTGLTGNPEGKLVARTDIPNVSLSFSEEPEDETFKRLWTAYERSGSEDWSLSYRSKVNLDAKKDVVDVDYMELDLDGAAKLSLDYKILGYRNFFTGLEAFNQLMKEARETRNRKTAEEAQSVMKDAVSQINLQNLEIVLDDKTLLTQVLSQMAADQDVSLDVVQQQAKGGAMLMTLGVTNPYLSDLATDFAESAQAFVINGGDLKFSISPDDDFELGPAFIESQTSSERSSKEIFGPLNADFEHIPN